MTKMIEMKAVLKGGIEMAKVQVAVTASEYLVGRHHKLARQSFLKDGSVSADDLFEVVEIIPRNQFVETFLAQCLKVESEMVVAKHYNPLDTRWLTYKQTQIGPYKVFYLAHNHGFVTYGFLDGQWG